MPSLKYTNVSFYGISTPPKINFIWIWASLDKVDHPNYNKSSQFLSLWNVYLRLPPLISSGNITNQRNLEIDSSTKLWTVTLKNKNFDTHNIYIEILKIFRNFILAFKEDKLYFWGLIWALFPSITQMRFFLEVPSVFTSVETWCQLSEKTNELMLKLVS